MRELRRNVAAQVWRHGLACLSVARLHFTSKQAVCLCTVQIQVTENDVLRTAYGKAFVNLNAMLKLMQDCGCHFVTRHAFAKLDREACSSALQSRQRSTTSRHFLDLDIAKLRIGNKQLSVVDKVGSYGELAVAGDRVKRSRINHFSRCFACHAQLSLIVTDLKAPLSIIATVPACFLAYSLRVIA